MESRNNSINDSRHRGGDPSTPVSPTPGGSNHRWMMYKMHKHSPDEPGVVPTVDEGQPEHGTIQSMSDRLHQQSQSGQSGQSGLPSSSSSPSGDFTGLISRAKDGLTQKPQKVSSRQDSGLPTKAPKKPEVQLSESDLQWETLEKYLKRPLVVRDLDFSDLGKCDNLLTMNL